MASTETTNIDTQPTTNAGETTTTKEDTAVIKNTESLKLIRSGVVNPIENDTCEKSNTDETGFTEMRNTRQSRTYILET